MQNSCAFQLKHQKKHAEQPHSFESGEMAVTLPTAALSGCGFGSLKGETEKSTSNYLVWVIGNDNDVGHLSWLGTCPQLKHTCVSLRVGDKKTSGWEKKQGLR